MKDSGPKIKYHREKAKWSTTKLSTLAGISQSFLWRLEAGKSHGSWDTYTKIASALGIPLEVLFPDRDSVEDAHPGWRKIPVLDYVQAGQWTSVDGNPKEDEIRETIMTDLEHSPKTFAMRIRDDSMKPKFNEGDMVVIDPKIEPRPGDHVVSIDENQVTTFRQYRDGGINENGASWFELHAHNDIYAMMRSDRKQLRIVGTMVEHRIYRKP